MNRKKGNAAKMRKIGIGKKCTDNKLNIKLYFMKNQNDLFAGLFEQFRTHARLVGAGVDSRSALEMTFGKKNSDESYETLAQIAGKEHQPNTKNN